MISYVIARSERSEGRGNPLYAMVAVDFSFRSLAHSGSPRAYALAMTRWCLKSNSFGLLEEISKFLYGALK